MKLNMSHCRPPFHAFSFLVAALLSASSLLADWGVYQSYVILDLGNGSQYFAGGENADNATNFDGFDLGSFASGSSMSLRGGELKTWKNNASNVCGGTLNYRVYESGSEPGEFTPLALSYDSELGGGNQKWYSSVDIDLLLGLEAGDYVFEVWWQSEGNWNDGGGCGEYQYESNGGSNYSASFSICPFGLDGNGECLTHAIELKGIIDFTVPNGGNNGKAIHVTALEDVADLSVFQIGVANNGGGTDGAEYTFDAISVSAGDEILVARSISDMDDYFVDCYDEFDVVLQAGSAIEQNGDDAIELFESSVVIETFGDIDVDGTGEDWDYLDSWAYKIDGAWTYGGVNCTDGTATIFDSDCLYPLCSSAASGCTNDSACNYNSAATDDDGSCTYPATGYDCEGNCLADSDSDGICDGDDNCSDTAACNYDDSANGSCLTNDACGVCGGSGIPTGDCDCSGNELDAIGECGGTCTADVDSDGVCDTDEVVGCQDNTACNYDATATDAGSCTYPDTGYDCNGTCLIDTDNDGVCDEFEVAGCQDNAACNYNVSATDSNGSCTYPTTGYDCSGNCLADSDSDGICDGDDNCSDTTACNYDDSANGLCQTLDDCGVCNGDNSTCADCAGVANGTSALDDCGVCNGDNSTCADCAGVANGTSTLDDCG
ncbi:MAG: hypothetical protein HOH92_09775, partial [Crocinitomicaceae bacterium]|nr:hypothetical protein [Crocinitomicaceae bacterium]